MSDTATNTATATATTSGAATVAGSAVGWFNEYAVVIGLSLTLVSILFGMYSHRQTMKWRERQDEAKVDALVAQRLAEIQGNGQHEPRDENRV